MLGDCRVPVVPFSGTTGAFRSLGRDVAGMTGRWQPILQGPASGRALDLVRRIASRIGRPSPDAPSPIDPSLSGGAAGQALLFSHLAELEDRTRNGVIADEWLDAAGRELARSAPGFSLFGGYTGVGFAHTLLAERSHPGVADPDDAASEIDDTLLRIVAAPGWDEDFDLVEGLVGVGVYALERLPRPTARLTLGHIVDQLSALVTASGPGLTWHTPARHLPPWQREVCPSGYENLGIAHGVPGVIAFLARVVASGVAAPESGRLLEGAVSWLLSCRRRSGLSSFPAWRTPGGDSGDCRAAWCYGDPGVAAALVLAGSCAGRTTWRDEGLEIALEAAARPLASSGVEDAGLCHGAAGLGHVFARLCQASGRQDLYDAAVFWLTRAAEMALPVVETRNGEPGVGSGRSTGPEDVDTSLLTGCCGTALALLSAAAPIEPTWDRAFLLSAREAC